MGGILSQKTQTISSGLSLQVLEQYLFILFC